MPLNITDLNSRIDAVLQADNFGRSSWYASTSVAPFEITYQFETAMAGDWPWSNVAAPVAYAEAYKEAVRVALEKYEAVLNVHFVETTDAADPTLSFYRSPDLYTDSFLLGGGRGRWRYSGSEWDGHVVFQDAYDLSAQSEFDLILHEIGHALGLKHPGNYDIGGGGTVGPYLPTNEDHDKYTVMSYNGNPDTAAESYDLMLYDIAALQKWWGVNATTHADNTVHWALDSTALKVVYDAGGVDWLRYEGTGKARIDLRGGAFSSLDGLDVAAVAYGTVIENAASGAGRDWLIGTSGHNILKGGGDHLRGGNGADILKGGMGADWLVAGKGADKLIGGAGLDHFVFNGSLKEGRNIIKDFNNDLDVIRIKGSEFAELEITSAGKGGVNTKILLDTGTVVILKGVESDLITEADFDFI